MNNFRRSVIKKLKVLNKEPPPPLPTESRLAAARRSIDVQGNKFNKAMEQYFKWQRELEEHWSYIEGLKEKLEELQVSSDELAKTVLPSAPVSGEGTIALPTLSLSALLAGQLDSFTIDFGSVFVLRAGEDVDQ